MSHRDFQVGDWLVQPDLNSVTPSQGGSVHIEGKVMAVLCQMAEEAGQLLSKKELIQRVWTDTFVSEDALFRCIRELRRVLHDDARAPRFIQTIPKKGYRLIAPVTWLDPPRHPQSTKTVESRSEPSLWADWMKPLFPVWCSFVVLVVFALGSRAWEPAPSQISIHNLAVLPFHTQDAELEPLGIALADTVAFKLSELETLNVASRASSLRFKDDPNVDPRKVSRELSVGSVLLGKLVQSESGLSITAELVSVANNELIWGDSFLTNESNYLKIQDEIGRKILARLQFEFAGAETKRLAKFYSDNEDANRLFLDGTKWKNQSAGEALIRAGDLFRKAIELESDFAAAHVGLAEVFAIRGFSELAPPHEAFPQSKQAALKAVSLDQKLAGAHASLAAVKEVYEWDWLGAEQGYQRAIAINPAYATARHWYALFLAEMGRFDEAFEQIRLARTLAPLSAVVNNNLGRLFYLARQMPTAERELQDLLEFNPRFAPARRLLALVASYQGEHDVAISEAQLAFGYGKKLPENKATLGYVLAAAGRNEEAEKISSDLISLRAVQYVSAYEIAILKLALGEEGQALDWLKRAYQERAQGLVMAAVDPRLEPLQDNVEFRSILRRIGLVQEAMAGKPGADQRRWPARL